MVSRRAHLLHWLDSGLVAPARTAAALAAGGVTPDPARWLRFLDVLLLVLGGLALASGVVFFIAFNWDALGRFSQFALLQVLLLVAVAAWWRLGIDRLPAQVALLTAAVLLGALLALFGQTYQTGADPWQLFATWALLMLPWALAGRFAPLWLLWLVLLNLSAAFWYDARFGLLGAAFASRDDLLWLQLLLNGAAWLTWEFAARRYDWLVLGRWPVRLIAIAVGFIFTVLVLRAIFDPDSPPILLAWGTYLAWLATVYAVYRRRLPDLFMLAGACLTLIACLTAELGWLLLDVEETAGMLLLIALAVIGQAAAAAVWLRNVHAEQAA
jgi:uncharacterized membrane protein